MTRGERWYGSNGLMDVKVAKHADKRTCTVNMTTDVLHETYIVVCSCACSVMYVKPV